MLTKKGLMLVFMFSLLTHMGVAGTLIYLPFQPSINNPVKNGERIIWTLVQGRASGNSRYRPSGLSSEERAGQKPEVRSEISEAETSSSIHKNSEDNNLVTESNPFAVDTLSTGNWVLRPVEDTKSQILATGDDHVNNTQISEVRSQVVDCNDSHCGEGVTYVSNSAIDRIVIEGEGDSGDGLKGFLEDVRREIERRKYYPAIARINGIEGTVYISFHIGSDDKPGDISIDRSSGFKILDESAIRTLKSINQLSYVPEEMRELNITVPIAYRLVEEGKRKGFSEKKHMTGK